MKHKNLLKAMLVLALALALLPAQPAYADTITVDTTSDALDAADSCSEVTIASLPGTDGVISLREAICAANNHSGPDTIEFDIAGCGGGVCTIQPTSALPTLTDDDTAIDGYTQDGAVQATDTTSATLTVEIDGTNAGVAVSGLTVNSDDNTLRGLVIRNFDYFGIQIGLHATGNTVAGNHIGTDVNGTTAQGNGESGVSLYGSAKYNIIGGDTAAERNVISGNDEHGVRIIASGTMSNTVSGNYIGLAADGTTDLGNGSSGVRLDSLASNNTIGGDTAGERNIISGNNSSGVIISDGGASGNVSDNTISGNYIGTDVSGTLDLGNDENGVSISSGAQNNTVERNVISGNGMDGVYIYGSDAMSNTISGNYIGTDANGTTALGNGSSGVDIRDGAQNNTIGGDTAAERNVISGNGGHGVWILGSGTMSNTISGNYIGTDVSGTAVLSNTSEGVHIDNGAYNTIGGDTAAERNVISGNGQHGVWIYGDDATGNIISGNTIGLAVNGTDPLGNDWEGVFLHESQNTTVGGDTAGQRNIISANGWHGISMDRSDGNTISGNTIGTDASGTLDRGNTRYGVRILRGAQSNTVGGDTAGERNVISGNGEVGVIIRGINTMSNTVVGNTIGTTVNGTSALGNTGHGVYIEYHAQNNAVEQNVISGNDESGVCIAGSGTMSNTISGNTIGTDESGTADLGNGDLGVLIISGAQNNTIGPGNVIAHNGDDGVSVGESNTIGNAITQNSIFSNTNGIDLWDGANGGITAPVIVTTTQGSVYIVGTACAGCTVEVFENGDTDGEGETYVGDTTADGSGAFTVTVSSLTQPYLTATATDAVSGTSEFSGVFTAAVELTPDSGTVYLPLIMRNH